MEGDGLRSVALVEDGIEPTEELLPQLKIGGISDEIEDARYKVCTIVANSQNKAAVGSAQPSTLQASVIQRV